MYNTEVTQSTEFECGYISNKVDGKPTMEFHRYKVILTVKPVEPLSKDQIIRFEDLSDILKNNLPAGMIIRENVASGFEKLLLNAFTLTSNPVYRIKESNICAETIAKNIGRFINIKLTDHGCCVHRLVLKENNDSSVVWTN